jgi:hypothetical protein
VRGGCASNGLARLPSAGAVTFSGLAYVGQPGVLANGEFDVRVICHGMPHLH